MTVAYRACFTLLYPGFDLFKLTFSEKIVCVCFSKSFSLGVSSHVRQFLQSSGSSQYISSVSLQRISSSDTFRKVFTPVHLNLWMIEFFALRSFAWLTFVFSVIGSAFNLRTIFPDVTFPGYLDCCHFCAHL